MSLNWIFPEWLHLLRQQIWYCLFCSWLFQRVYFLFQLNINLSNTKLSVLPNLRNCNFQGSQTIGEKYEKHRLGYTSLDFNTSELPTAWNACYNETTAGEKATKARLLVYPPMYVWMAPVNDWNVFFFTSSHLGECDELIKSNELTNLLKK